MNGEGAAPHESYYIRGAQTGEVDRPAGKMSFKNSLTNVR